MILLPRGTPLKEKVDPGRVNIPDALRKLRDGRFSGYLRFDFSDATGIIIFEKGRLISALHESEREKQIAYDALALIFEQSLQGGARLDIYRLAPNLAMSIHALLHGKILYRGQDLKLIDIRALLPRLKEENFSGCLRIYTEEHIALIFYQAGSPLGFFHDGSTEIEKTADASMSVAKMPGAKIDVLSAKETGDLVLADLMESADLGDLWRKTQEQMAQHRRTRLEEASRTRELQERNRRRKVLGGLKEIAEKHVGKIGGSLVEKEFDKTMGVGGSPGEAEFARFFGSVSKAAKLVAGPSKVKAMIEEMKKSLESV